MSDDPNTFAVGDTVRVSNIPGPRMVVVGIVAKDGALVQTVWFNRRFELEGHAFRPRFLSKATPWEDRPRFQTLGESFEEVADAHD